MCARLLYVRGEGSSFCPACFPRFLLSLQVGVGCIQPRQPTACFVSSGVPTPQRYHRYMHATY